MEQHQKHEAMREHRTGNTRIPMSLQAVFLNGNRGHEVNIPPPDTSAMKIFRSGRWRQLRAWSFSMPRAVTTAQDTLELEAKRKVKTRKKLKRSKVSHG
jgi:hypothetical protein